MCDSVYKKLMDCGQKKMKTSDFIGLNDFVEELDIKQMMKIISGKIFGVEAPQILNYLMMGFSQNESSYKKRLELCQGVLNEIQSRDIPSRNIVALTSRIALELDKFSTPHLVSIAEQCLEFMRNSNSSTQISWKDLLPKVLTVVMEKKEIDFAGAEMSGTEFRQRIIQTICGIQWHPKIVTSIASMFIEMQLTIEEHLQVVNKLCGYLDELPPQEIPPLIHHLLELCKDQHGVTVFLALRRYFASNIYNLDVNKCSEDSTHENTDEIQNMYTKELVECESMVLYHIEESAKLSRGCVSDLLKLAKTSANCPEIILDHFLLAVLLSLSSISTYEVQVIEILKSAIWRSVIEEEHKQESAWLCQMINTQCNIESILTQLIKSKVCERDKILRGLVTLNLTLLGTTAAKGKEHLVELLWKFGRHALILLVKRQRQVAKTVLQSLTDHIITGQNVIQYADCLNIICNSATLIVLENLPIMIRLLDFLSQLPGTIAKRVITAVLSVVRISNRLRYNLILVLRKALFSREIETRKIAVSGFLQLLKYFRINGLAVSSQSENNYSSPSVFTQISLDIHSQESMPSTNSSNEAVCFEVLGILRRCFMQQASVKICLYEGLYVALFRNPELCPSVLDMLLDHFNQFYESDIAILSPLNLAKAIKIIGMDTVLQEPIGKLMFAIQQIVVRASEELGDAEQPRSLEKFTEILTSIVTRLISCDIHNFDLDEATNLLDIVPESLQKQEIIVQTLGVYEAMMAYVVNSWCISSTPQQGQQLLLLYKGYNKIVEFVKNCKSGKKEVDGGAKKNANMDKEKIQGKKPVTFKVPETILNFNSILRMLSLLLSEDLPWATEEARADIKGRRILHRYALQAANEVIQQTKNQMSQFKSSAVLKHCVQLASLLYNQCLRKYNEVSTFDMSVAVLSVECFTDTIALLITHFKNNISEIIYQIVDLPKDAALSCQVKVLFNVYIKLLDEAVQNGDEDDILTKKLLQIVISGLPILAQQLPTDSSQLLKMLDWITNFAQNRNLPVVLHAKLFITLLFSLISRCKSEFSLLDSLAVQLCHVFGTINEVDVEESPTTLKIINEGTKTTALQLLCSNLISCLEQVDWLIIRLRAENTILIHPTANMSSPDFRHAAFRRREKELVQQLGYCINVAQSICYIAVPPGPCTEAVFKLLSHTYNTLISLTKYFSSISTPHDLVYQDSRFGRAVKLAGTNLSLQISELILYVEDVRIEDKNKNKNGSILLSHIRKQTIYIPRLVGDLENFAKAITLLSNKCKDQSLSTNVKLTIMRDFSLHTKKLELIMNRNNQSESEEEEEDGAAEVQVQEAQHQASQQSQALQQEPTSQKKDPPTNSSNELYVSQQDQAVRRKHPPRKRSDSDNSNRPSNKRKKTTEN